MKIFFSSRQKMRSVNFGQQHDHGQLATKRWARDLSDVVSRSNQDKRISVLENAKGSKVEVITYNTKSKII
jgi:hypothetical protein